MVKMLAILYEFKAPYSRFVKVVTIATTTLLISLSTYFLYILTTVDEGSIAFLAPLPIVLTLLLIIPFLFSPRGYALTEAGVLIKRPIGGILIPYGNIANVRVVTEGLGRGIRLWGSGGLYGFIGLFHIKNLGRVWVYATDHNKMVLIETRQGTKYIISPDDPTAFIERLTSMF